MRFRNLLAYCTAWQGFAQLVDFLVGQSLDVHQDHFIELFQSEQWLQARDPVGVGSVGIVADAEELEIFQLAQACQLLVGKFVVGQRQVIQLRQAGQWEEVRDLVLRKPKLGQVFQSSQRLQVADASPTQVQLSQLAQFCQGREVINLLLPTQAEHPEIGQ